MGFRGSNYGVIAIQNAVIDSLTVIGENGAGGAYKVVRSLFKSNDVELRRRAVTVAGTIAQRGAPDIISDLTEISQADNDSRIRAAALTSLEKLGDPVMKSVGETAVYLCFCLFGMCWGVIFMVVALGALRELLIKLGTPQIAVDPNAVFIVLLFFWCLMANRKKILQQQLPCCQPDVSPEYDKRHGILAKCSWRR